MTGEAVVARADEQVERGASNPWPRRLLLLAIAIHLAMFLSLFFGYLNPLFDNSDMQKQAVDFFSIYQGGDFALHGHSIYGWVTPYDHVPYHAPYRYLPFFAYTGAILFNALPPWPAYWRWVALLEVLLVANAWLTWRLAPDRRWGLVAASLWFMFTPFYLEEYMGQWSFLMATLMLWAGVALWRGRAALSGLPWMLSVLIKTNSALLGPIFLRLRQWRVLALAAVLVVALNVPYFIARPHDGRVFWDMNFGSYWKESPGRNAVMNSGDLGGVAYIRNAWLIVDENASDMPGTVERVVVLGVIGLSLAATFLPRRPDALSLFAVWSSAFFLVYFAWEHHYVMLLPALALLVALRKEYRGVALFAFVMVALPTPYFLFQHFLSDAPPGYQDLGVSPQAYWPSWATVVDHAVKPLPVFVLWGTLVWDQVAGWWTQRRPSAAAAAVQESAPSSPPH